MISASPLWCTPRPLRFKRTLKENETLQWTGFFFFFPEMAKSNLLCAYIRIHTYWKNLACFFFFNSEKVNTAVTNPVSSHLTWPDLILRRDTTVYGRKISDYPSKPRRAFHLRPTACLTKQLQFPRPWHFANARSIPPWLKLKILQTLLPGPKCHYLHSLTPSATLDANLQSRHREARSVGMSS